MLGQLLQQQLLLHQRSQQLQQAFGQQMNQIATASQSNNTPSPTSNYNNPFPCARRKATRKKTSEEAPKEEARPVFDKKGEKLPPESYPNGNVTITIKSLTRKNVVKC